MGYHLAGLEKGIDIQITGVDIKHGKRYPFNYIREDVLNVISDTKFLDQFDLINASPPCQKHSRAKHLMVAQGNTTSMEDFIPETRAALIKSGKPYVIENVVGSPLINTITVCGSSFGLQVRRHRLFESNISLVGSICNHKQQGKPVGVYGALGDQPQGRSSRTGEYVYGGRIASTIEEAQNAMGIDWMKWGELKEAIPPLYLKYLADQWLRINGWDN
jgi:DNA (cytosine-5)-methyltransferase 1